MTTMEALHSAIATRDTHIVHLEQRCVEYQTAAEEARGQAAQAPVFGYERDDWAARQHEEHLAGFMRGTTVADGIDQVEIKKWLECATTAFAFIPGLQIHEARRGLAKASRGALRQAIQEFEGPNPTLDTLLNWIKSRCVTRDRYQEIYDIETYCQGPTQPLQYYIAQFRSKVQRAYKPEDLANELISTQLIRLFVNGLRNDRVRYAAAQMTPTTLDEAYEVTMRSERATTWVRDGRQEEPMDIGVLPPPPPELVRPPQVDVKDVIAKAVSRQMAGLQKQMSELRRSLQPREDERPRSRSSKEPPKCFYCGKVGHFKRECRKLQHDEQRRSHVAGNE